ncbi:MAG: hypothetical protein JW945_06535 [Methanomicrobia archaeon]|nr:hypothetical protein [Methanomicrobia archaeon]
MTAFWKSEQAVSEVVGVLLIMAILLSLSAIFFSREVPAWTKEFEYQHAAKVPQDFAALGAQIDMALASEDPATPLSTAIGMTPGTVPLVGLQAAEGTLTFEPDEETFECIATTLEAANTSGNAYWNDSSTWTKFEKYHVKVTDSGVRLESDAGEYKDPIETNGTLSGEYYCDRFIVRNNSTLTVPGRLTIHAMNIFVDEGTLITADGWGYAGGAGNKPGYNGSGTGGGKGGDEGENKKEGGYGGGGGGCGGEGGRGGNNTDSGGSASHLNDLMGSGGGGGGDWKDPNGKIVLSSGGAGGSGGGYIQLDAATIDIRGIISANGSDGVGAQLSKDNNFFGGGGGGGSGGLIIIKGNVVNITGMLYAMGGDGGSNDDKGTGGGGGGGGEIHVYYDSSIFPNDVKADHINVGYGNGGSSGKEGAEDGKNGTPGSPVVNQSLYFPSIFYYSSGYIVSNMINVSDQGQVGYDTKNSTLIRYGNVTYGSELPPDTDIVLKVRTSMCPDMHDALPWEDCPPVANNTYIPNLPSASDGHQYIQWRAELLTFDPRITPVLSWVNISYEYGKRPVLVTSSGHLDYKSQYLYFPNYQLVHTHGGTIKLQDDESFMLFAPPIFVSTDDSGISLKITAVNLTGTKRTLSGRLSATVQASYLEDTLLTNGLNFANITLNITTNYPAAWADWFNTTCKDAGIVYGNASGQYNITYKSTAAPDTLQIVFYGNETKPVNLWLKRSRAKVEITS